jgi:broad specificity phosphatase PhoE
MTTAQILARSLNIEPTPLEGLIDIDYGDWQGLSAEEAEAQYPKLYSLWLESPHLVAFPKGESLEQVLSRAMAAIEALSTIHSDQTVILVSHKVVCKVLMCTFLGLELSQFWQVEQHTCCINGVEIKPPSPVVGLLNDTCHLSGVR